MGGADADRRAEAKANDLYWGSELSVNQIAEELGLSKSVLYGLIRPRPTGLACPECAEELVHPNRTARERSLVACSACGWEGGEDDADTVGGEGSVSFPPLEGEGPAEEAPPAPDARNRTVLGGALLGAAAGLALVLWARRR
jgi:predicted RNA-binding Zn-ribbon protein involved in translation (DUF1610 family)